MNNFASFHPHPGICKKLPPSDICIILILLFTLCIQTFFLFHRLNKSFLHETTIRYGEINEGIVGVPVHKNPLYASSAVEEGIASLIHAGLLKYDNEGNYIPHLAATWNKEGPDRYLFILRKNSSFHNGFPITTKDVIHTIKMIQETQKYKTPYHKPWSGVQVNAVDETALTITVPEGNLYFPENFTVPILPEHIWKKIPKDKRKNYKGSGVYVGAGPYMYSQETITLDERPTNITLTEFPGYALGRPFVKKIQLHFFVNTNNLLKAYETGSIDGIHGITATELSSLLKQREKGEDEVYTAYTNRVFGVFFNTEDGRILQDSFLRSILSQWVKRRQITDKVFNKYATPIQTPLATDTKIKEQDISLEELEQTLEDIGWKFESTKGKRERSGIPLEITFVFQDTEETKQIAEILIQGWQRIGVGVKTQTLPEKEIKKAVREREFDAILYGYKANQPKDLAKLWKSGDTENLASVTSFGSPKLNELLINLESTKPPDRLAERLSRVPNDNWQNTVYNEIKVEMMKSVPAIFLYSPHFLYILPDKIMGVSLKEKQLGRISNSSDRFTNVHKWYLKREKVWKFLVEN